MMIKRYPDPILTHYIWLQVTTGSTPVLYPAQHCVWDSAYGPPPLST